MSNLLNQVLDAQGGLEKLSAITQVRATMSVGGPFWAFKGQPNLLGEETIIADARNQIIELENHGRRIRFDQPAALLTITRDEGESSALLEPRGSFAGFENATAWSAEQTAYFIGYASWMYVNEPWLFAQHGIEAREIEPWDEAGETWRRLEVTFPRHIASHSTVQTYYFDETYAQRRMDYSPDINGGVNIAHYTRAHARYGDLLIPTERTIYPRRDDNTADFTFAPITLQIHGFIAV